jgi:AraC-like DNA-binding protein
MSTRPHADSAAHPDASARPTARNGEISVRRWLVFLCFSLGFCVARANNTFHVIDASDGLTDNQIQHILQLPDGRMAITTLSNINLFDGAGFHYIHKQESNLFNLPDYHGAYHVYAGDDQLLWVKNWNGLLCLDLRHQRYMDNLAALFRKMGFHQPVSDLFLDSGREVWALTPRGLQRAGDKCCYPLPPESGNLQDMDVRGRKLFLFFATGEVVCYPLGSQRPSYRIAAYPTGKRNLYGATSLVVAGADGRFYQLRTGARAIFLSFDPARQRWATLLEVPYILHTLVLTPDMNAYVTCPKGYWHFDLPSGTKTLVTSLTTDDGRQVSGVGLNTVFRDRQGGIWMGTYDRGLLYTCPSLYRFVSRPYGKTFPAPEPISPYSTFPHPTFRGKTYNCVLTDSRGWTWAGTPDGLCLFRPSKKLPETFHSGDGLPNDFVHALAEDRHGGLWIATSNGIAHLIVNGRTGEFTFTSYNRHDGTLQGEYRDNMASAGPDGSIRFCGVDGYTIFHPDSVKPYSAVLTPLLTDISLFGEPLQLGRSYDGRILLRQAPAYTHRLDLEHGQNALSFTFTSLNYAAPHQTFYRYRLMGNDTTWHIAQAGKKDGLTDEKGLLHLSFVDLRPGTYRIQVMASTNPDQWAGKMNEVEFTVHAPWWATTTAYCIYFAVAALLVLAALRIYMHLQQQRLIRRQKEKALLQRIQDLVRQTEPEQADDDAGETADSAHSTSEAEFIRKAASLVEQHLGQQGYSVAQLSQDLCMDRTGLYRKLNTLLDQSPTLFIRHIRLQKAAQLIQEGNLTINEIAFRTGFSSASYLGKCFLEEFGCRPTDYAQRTQKS